jgi:hypothetical protein
MKQSHRLAGLASVLLMVSSSFVACGGLDPRKVTRGPAYSSGGDDASGGTEASTGGTESGGGEPNVNPFGGAFDLGGAPPVVDGPPEVAEVDPAHEATNVDVGRNVSFLFSEAVNPETITNDSVKLLLRGSEVEGDVSLDRDVIGTFEPARRLALASQYETVVSTDVTDTTNQPLQEAFSSSFITRDGEWETGLAFVEEAAGWNYYSTVGVGSDDRGNALVVWIQDDGLWARWHRQGAGWQAPELMGTGYFGYSGYDMAVSPDGDALVVFPDPDGNNLVSRRYSGGAWSALPDVIPGTANTSDPQLAFKGGHAVAWWQDTSSGNYLYASTTTSDGTWSASPTYLNGANATQDFGYSAIAMDSSGNAMLVHNVVVTSSGIGQLFFNKFVAATGAWESSAPIPDTVVDRYARFSLALEDSGVAMVAWPASTDLMATRYTKAKGFATAVPVDDLATAPLIDARASVVYDGADFIIAWSQLVGATSNAYANRYSTEQAKWLGAELLSDGNSSIFAIPVAVADPQGNALVVWSQRAPSSGSGSNYDNVAIKFARWTGVLGAWSSGDTGAAALGYDHVSISGSANGIANVVSQDHGNYADRPGQPFLNIFR